MPVPLKLGVSFTQAEIDAMKAGIQVVIDTIQSKIILNLSTKERKDLSKLSNERIPYVGRSIREYALDYPQFNPLAYAYGDVKQDFPTYLGMETVLSKLTEATEVSIELQMVAGHFCFLFMRKQYELAETNKDQNVPGAQVIYDGLKDCFEGQGNFRPCWCYSTGSAVRHQQASEPSNYIPHSFYF